MRMVIRKLKKRKRNIILKIIMIVIISVFVSFKVINIFSKKVTPYYMDNACEEVKKLIVFVVNNSINEEVINKIDEEELFNITKNNDGEIILIEYNSKVVNNYLTLVVRTISNNLIKLEEGRIDDLSFSKSITERYDKKLLSKGIIYEIPFLSITNSNMLSNIGPNIYVRFNLIRDISGGIDTKINEYGINNAYMEVDVKVNVNVNINLLNLNKTISVSSSIPIAMKIIQGNIPNFYTGGISSSFYINEGNVEMF